MGSVYKDITRIVHMCIFASLHSVQYSKHVAKLKQWSQILSTGNRCSILIFQLHNPHKTNVSDYLLTTNRKSSIQQEVFLHAASGSVLVMLITAAQNIQMLLGCYVAAVGLFLVFGLSYKTTGNTKYQSGIDSLLQRK